MCGDIEKYIEQGATKKNYNSDWVKGEKQKI